MGEEKEEGLYGYDLGCLMLGAAVDGAGHWGLEPVFDKLLKDSYPEMYGQYSSGVVSGIMAVIIVMLMVGARRMPERIVKRGVATLPIVLDRFAWGLVMGEIVQILNLVRETFNLGE